jgi:N-acetylmuramoyl-L-alanine amidase
VNAISPGDRGPAVSDVQKRLRELGFVPPGFEADARETFYGEATAEAVREFQEKRGLRVDGRVDENTWHDLVEASFNLGDRFLYLRIPAFRGDDVREVQGYLNRLGFNAGREDGIFGQETDLAVRSFQHDMGLPVDGIVGSSTIACVQRLRHALKDKDTSVAEVHEALQDQAARGLADRSIVLDAEEGDAAAEAVLRHASHELVASGLPAIITGGSTAPAPESQRARLANDHQVDLVLGLRTVGEADFRIYYFGSGGYSSPRGRRLAEMLYGEISADKARSVHPPETKSFPLLRETRMPCVIVESPPIADTGGGLSLALARSILAYFL